MCIDLSETVSRGLGVILTLMAWLMPGPLGAQEAGIEIAGRLLPEGQENLADWRILAGPRMFAELPRDHAGQPLGTTPHPDGTFVLQDLEPGWQYVCAYFGERLDVESVVPVRLTENQEPQPEVTLKPRPPGSQVEFALLQENGTPLGRKVKVHLYNVHGEVDGRAGGVWSDEAGVVRFEQLPSTRYDLWMEAEPTSPGEKGLPAILFRNLEVTPGPEAQRIDLKVPRPGAVKGRLLLNDGKTPAQGYVVAVQSGTVPEENMPPEGWEVAYARGGLTCYAQTEVTADGTFALRGLTPGKHLLDVRRPGEREAWQTISDVEVTAGQTTDLGTVEVPRNGWQTLFDRKTLAGWRESDFWGRSAVRIENDRIVMAMGNDMTGITWTGDLPRIDYEVTLQAMRIAESDFFCGLTFPVQEDYCSLILGGWGGSVVGLSSLDGYDASENETSQWIRFDQRRWYRVRVRVTREKIEAWLDLSKIIDVNLAGRRISTRIEVDPSKPFGLATWRTTGAVRDLRLRRLDTAGGV